MKTAVSVLQEPSLIRKDDVPRFVVANILWFVIVTEIVVDLRCIYLAWFDMGSIVLTPLQLAGESVFTGILIALVGAMIGCYHAVLVPYWQRKRMWEATAHSMSSRARSF